ncbi:hypothetical protein HNP72_002072 [Sphingobacterium soli]|nr:hypothetical protein [Sphingobacterium soli]
MENLEKLLNELAQVRSEHKDLVASALKKIEII